MVRKPWNARADSLANLLSYPRSSKPCILPTPHDIVSNTSGFLPFARRYKLHLPIIGIPEALPLTGGGFRPAWLATVPAEWFDDDVEWFLADSHLDARENHANNNPEDAHISDDRSSY